MKFFASVAKRLKLKVRKFWGLIPTFVEVAGEKLVRVPFCLPPPLIMNRVKDTLMVSDNFKNKQKCGWSNVFWYVIVCILLKSIYYTKLWDETQILKKFHSDKTNNTKNVHFFLSRAPNMTVYFCDSCYEKLLLNCVCNFPFLIPLRYY